MKEYIGYRYSKVGQEIYITKLRLYNEFANPLYKKMPIDFFTTDCIVEEIYNANTKERVISIDGKAWYPFQYSVGQRISGTSVYYCKTRIALSIGYLCKDLSGKITDKISDIFRIYTPIYPGLSYAAGAMIKTISDEKQLFEELNAFFLAAEKRFFSDEIRTIEEINHVDPLTWENLPPELRLEDLSMDRLQRLWDIAATHNDVTTDDLIDIIKEHEPVCATCPFP